MHSIDIQAAYFVGVSSLQNSLNPDPLDRRKHFIAIQLFLWIRGNLAGMLSLQCLNGITFRYGKMNLDENDSKDYLLGDNS